ncbi:hypothetical protein [uncultured Mediterranean phage uvMED]|nr:hypothetical protein [uncultured Mediterranean phage uvMED]
MSFNFSKFNEKPTSGFNFSKFKENVFSLDSLYQTVFNFEGWNQDPDNRSTRHNNHNAHIWTESSQEELFNATGIKGSKGDEFTSNGKTFYTAYYDNEQDGLVASKFIVDNLLRKADGNPSKFYSIHSGLPEDSDTVQNFVKILKENNLSNLPKSVESSEPKKSGFNFSRFKTESQQIGEDLPLIEQDERYISFQERFFKRFAEGLLPFGYDPNLPETKESRDMVADVAGQVLGNIAGFIPFAFITGGVAPAVKGLGALTKGAKVLEKGKLIAKVPEISIKAAKQQGIKDGIIQLKNVKDVKQALRLADYGEKGRLLKIESSGILGKTMPYRKVITNVSAYNPLLGSALDAGVRGVVTMTSLGQVKLPLATGISERQAQLKDDAIIGLVAGASNIPQALIGTKSLPALKEFASSAGVFSVGVGGQFLLEEAGVAERMSLSENIAQASAFTALHHLGLKQSKYTAIKKQREALRSFGYDEKSISEILKDNRAFEEAMRKADLNRFKVRDRKEQNIFVTKDPNGVEEEWDLIGFYTKKKSGITRAIIRDKNGYEDRTLTMAEFFKGWKKVDPLKSAKNEVNNLDVRGTLKKQKKNPAYQAARRTLKDTMELDDVKKLREKDIIEINRTMVGKESIEEMSTSDLIIMRNVFDTTLDSKKFTQGDMQNLVPKMGRGGFLASKLLLPASLTLKQIGTKYNSNMANNLSKKMVEFTFRKSGVEGVGDALINATIFKGLNKIEKGKYKNALSPLIDVEQFGGYQPKLKEKLLNKKIKVDGKEVKFTEKALKNYEEFSDIMFSVLAESGAKVKSYKGSKSITEDIWSAVYKKGGKDFTITGKDLDNRDPFELIKMLKAKKGERVRIKIREGVTEEVTLSKNPNSKYSKNYFPRVITSEAREFFFKTTENTPFRMQMISKHIDNDEKLSAMRAKGGSKAEEASRIAGEQLQELFMFMPENGVYGSQYGRRARLPGRVYLDEQGNVITPDKIPVKNRNGKEIQVENYSYEKGDLIDGKKVKKVINVYETDFEKVIAGYTTKVAHNSAVSRVYGHNGGGYQAKGGQWTTFEQQVPDADVSEWVQNTVNRQIAGQQPSATMRAVMKPIKSLWGTTASLGLSAPTSGFKNILLAQREIFSTFNFMDMFKAYSSLLKNPKHYALMTRESGAFNLGSKQLELLKSGGFKPLEKLSGLTGLMPLTESTNRMTALVTARFAANSALDALNGKATLAKGNIMSKARARELLEDTFGLDVDNILQRSSKGKAYLTDDEKGLAMHMGHAMTQGLAELPFIPSWMEAPIARPLTLFYRIAYRVTENTYKNVYVPLRDNGNPVGLLKYLGATYMAGMAQEALYHNLFNQPKKKYGDIAEKTYDKILRAEGLAMFTNAFDEYGGAIESYKPVIFRTIDSTINEATAVMLNKKKADEGIQDWAKQNIVLYNKILQAVDTKISKTDRKKSEKFKKLVNEWHSRTRKQDFSYAGMPTIGTTRSPYYRKLAKYFWNDSVTLDEKAKAYWSAYWVTVHSLMNENPVRYRKEYVAKRQARKNLSQIISSFQPVNLSRKRKSGQKQSDYDTWRRTLNASEYRELQDLEKRYTDRAEEFRQARINLRYDSSDLKGDSKFLY